MYHQIDIYVILLGEATGSAATLSGVMVLISVAISAMDCYLPPAHNAKGESRGVSRTQHYSGILSRFIWLLFASKPH